MKKHIICGRPLSPRELVWGIVAVIAFTVACGVLFWYPILSLVALGVSVVAFGRGGFLQEFKRAIRNVRDIWREGYWLKYQ